MDRMLPICSRGAGGGQHTGREGTCGISIQTQAAAASNHLLNSPPAQTIPLEPHSQPASPAAAHVLQQRRAVEQGQEELVEDGVEDADAKPGARKGHDHQVDELHGQHALAQEAAGRQEGVWGWGLLADSVCTSEERWREQGRRGSREQGAEAASEPAECPRSTLSPVHNHHQLTGRPPVVALCPDA